jgi:formate hydrogenlyase subunit 4
MLAIFVKLFCAIFLVPLGGALIMGLDRKITARMQGRIGPPLLQPIYDVLKLFSKQAIFLNRMQIMYAFSHLTFMILVVILLTFGQDMLLALFVHAFATISLILGGMCVRSPYSRIGSQRKTLLLLAYEPILVLMVVGIYLTNGSFASSTIVAAGQKPLLLSLPLVFMTYIVAMSIELQKSPFDVASSHHAHQEIVKGVTLEYAGPYLGIIELAHFYEVFLLFAVVAIFWASPLYIGIGLAALCFVGQMVLDNTFARLSAMWILKFMWTIVLWVATTNIIWLYYVASYGKTI